MNTDIWSVFLYRKYRSITPCGSLLDQNIHSVISNYPYGSNGQGMYEDEEIRLPPEIFTSQAHIDQEVLAANLLGLGLWRLRPVIKPKLSTFSARIEGIIRQCC